MVVAKFATTTQHGAIEGKTQTHMTEYYNLDVIISVGYRVKSQRGIEFRRWANKVLKDYIIKGYAINDKRLEALQKTVEIQAKMLATAIEGDSDEVLKAVTKIYDERLKAAASLWSIVRDSDMKKEYSHELFEKNKDSITI